MNVLILGMNPSSRGGKAKSLHRLYSWMDEIGIETFSFDNIYPSAGEFSLNQVDTEYLKGICSRYEKIVTLGKTASYVLDRLSISHFSLPHPSGLNRLLNDKKFVHHQLKMCKNYLYGGSI